MSINSIKPITPNEVSEKTLPDWIIKGTNACIKDHFDKRLQESFFTEDTLKSYCMQFAPNCVEDILEDMWENIEPIYTAAGWNVEYSSKDDIHLATFTFRK